MSWPVDDLEAGSHTNPGSPGLVLPQTRGHHVGRVASSWILPQFQVPAAPHYSVFLDLECDHLPTSPRARIQEGGLTASLGGLGED